MGSIHLVLLISILKLNLLIGISVEKGESDSSIFIPERCLMEFRKGALTRHNEIRASHLITQLDEIPDLDKSANDKAAFLMLNQDEADKFIKGQNVYTETLDKKLNVSNPNSCYQLGEQVTNIWNSESEDFDFKNPVYDPEWCRFTQLIWKSTRKVGFGMALNSNNTLIIVGLYNPRGNSVKKFKKNITKKIE